MKKIKNYFTSIVFLLCVFGFCIVFILLPDTKYSVTERRKLEEFPEVSMEKLLDGTFTGKFESYSLDQFPMRDTFRQLKNRFVMNLMMEKSSNGYYKVGDYVAKLEYPENWASVENALEKFQNIYDRYLKDTECSNYVCLIPDKNYYMAQQNGYLSIDYDDYMQTIIRSMDYCDDVNISDTLSIDNFYFTDQHWKQETLIPTADRILSALGNGTMSLSDYEIITEDRPFAGTYYSQSAMRLQKDVLKRLVNDDMNNFIVTSYDSGKPSKSSVYTLSDLESNDMYDVFLGGPDALITIENPKIPHAKELIVFRDSFGSSIAPILASKYSKVTIVDLRYINYQALNAFIDFDHQDVLFLYSTLILNNSFSFK